MDQGPSDTGTTGTAYASTTRRRLLAGGAALGALSGLAGRARPAAAAVAAPAPAPLRWRPGERTRYAFVLSHEQFRTPYLLDLAGRAERAGFDGVWTSDHLQPWQDNERHSMMPWLTQALISERTSRVFFGTGVTCPTYRYHPSVVAQAFASLGILAPGRVFLGVGTGEALNEEAGTGRFGPYEERAARLVEAIMLIRRLWTGERVSFRGRYYQTEQLKLYDVPERPVPLYVAASGPRSARLAGRFGDGWVCGAADLAEPALRRAFREGAEQAGKDPDAMPILVEQFVVAGGLDDARYAARRWRFTVNPWGRLLQVPNPVTIERLAEQWWSLPYVYRGWPRGLDPAPHVEAVRALEELGATHVFLHSGQADQETVVDFYGRRVLPVLRRPAP